MYSISQKKVSPQHLINPDLWKHIPSDLIIDNILPRLPVKSLIRFSATNKTWYSVIKSPQFIASHLKFNRPQDKDQYLLFFDKMCRIIDGQTFVEIANYDYNFVPMISWDRYCQSESCNGLFLLRKSRDYISKFFLWNPSVRKSRELVTVCEDTIFYKDGTVTLPFTFHGLGFNETCNDHRVVRVSYFVDGIPHHTTDKVSTEVDVYSVSTNLWRRVQADPGRSLCSTKGMYLNGAYHWFAKNVSFTPGKIVEGRYFQSILLFDFVEECFREMAFSEHFPFYDKLVEFQEFEGSLGAVFCDSFSGDRLYLWVMTEYGVAESWTKKLTVKLEVYYRHLGFTKKGGLICQWCDSEDENSDDVSLNIGKGEFQWRIEGRFNLVVSVVEFTESLVLLGG